MIAFIANGSIISKRIRPDYQQTDNIMNPQVTVPVLLRPSRRLGQCVRKQQPITMTSHVSQPAAPRTWFARRRGTQRLFSNTTTSSSSGGGNNDDDASENTNSHKESRRKEFEKQSEQVRARAKELHKRYSDLMIPIPTSSSACSTIGSQRNRTNLIWQ